MDNNSPSDAPLSKLYILLDACIFQLAGNSNKSKSEGVINCLTNLSNEGFKLALSEFTVYENLHGLWGRRAEEAAKILRKYEWKVVSSQVLSLASILGGLYYDAGYDKDRIRDGDKIIASTALLETGLILTENHRDFPHPFFINYRDLPITYIDGHHNRTIDLALYKPNFTLIARRIEENEKRNN